jgi:membrane protein
MEEYLDTKPRALANRLVRHFDLSAPTASLIRSVLMQSKTHELGSALIAIALALLFGVGFGRVLQVVHARAWRLDLPARQTDQARYAAVLLGLYGLILLLLVQLDELAGAPSWVGLAVAPGWIALVVVFFVWAPRLLTHKLIGRRDLLPGAVLTAVGLVALMLVSSYVMEYWVNLHAVDYGGFGVVMAIFFWIAFSSALIVVAACVARPLAERRALRRGDGPPNPGLSRGRARKALVAGLSSIPMRIALVVLALALWLVPAAAASFGPPLVGVPSTLKTLPFANLRTEDTRPPSSCTVHAVRSRGAAGKVERKLAPVACEQPPRSHIAGIGFFFRVTP